MIVLNFWHKDKKSTQTFVWMLPYLLVNQNLSLFERSKFYYTLYLFYNRKSTIGR